MPRIHHIDCATLCPLSARLVNGEGGWLRRGTMVCHCLLVETDDGLVLVDTGLGTGDVEDPDGRLGRLFTLFVGPGRDLAKTAAGEVRRLGFRIEDVRHIVVTHLDLDHAGGLPDFPEAAVHVFAPEYKAAMALETAHDRRRYKPVHWAHGPRWALHRLEGERWLGFDSVRAVADDVLLIPLLGHSAGHCGVAVRDGGGWLLHAGDAYFHHRELDDPPSCPPGLALFQRFVALDDRLRRNNQERLRTLRRDQPDVRIHSAHCPVELAAFAGAPAAAGDTASSSGR